MNVRWMAIALIWPALLATARAGDIERDPPPQETLQAVLDRIRTHAAGDSWKAEGWSDPAIEAWIDKLLKQLSESTGKELTAPVRFKDTRPAGDMDLLLNGQLRIGKNVKHSTIQNSIVLADGVAELSIVRNSIVIARSIVTTSTVDNSLIIAGRYFRTSSTRVVAGQASTNILLSRGYGEISIARNAILSAPLGVDVVSLADNVTFLNCKPRAANPAIVLQQNNVQNVNGKPLPLGEPPVSPLEKQLELIGYMALPQGAMFRWKGVRLFAEKDQPIVDERGEAVKDLAGWKLSHVDARMAHFSNGDQEACILKPR